MKFVAPLFLASSVLCAAGIACAQPATAPAKPAAAPAAAPATTTTTTTVSRTTQIREGAVDIASQPARDIGASKVEIPPVLVKASQDPYGLAGLKSCKQIGGAIGDLTQVLGPDFQRGASYKENRAAKLAEAGGKTVVNSFIPFRGLVREVTGAAPADRRHQAAVEIGYARRGFLRGVYLARSCRPRY